MAHRRPAAGGLSARRGVALALALAGCAAVAGAQSASPAVSPVPGASTPAGALPTWTVDPTHTAVHWEVLHMSTSTLRGRFGKLVTSVQFDPAARRLEVSVAVDTASVTSGVPILDALLKGKEMLDVATYPQAYFVAKDATFDGPAPRELRGEFTLRGQGQPLTLRATRWNCALNPLFRRTVCGGDFEGEFLRSSVGITHSLPFVADQVRLLVEVEAISP